MNKPKEFATRIVNHQGVRRYLYINTVIGMVVSTMFIGMVIRHMMTMELNPFTETETITVTDQSQRMPINVITELPISDEEFEEEVQELFNEEYKDTPHDIAIMAPVIINETKFSDQPASSNLAQYILESGILNSKRKGKASRLAEEYNNYYGMKYTASFRKFLADLDNPIIIRESERMCNSKKQDCANYAIFPSRWHCIRAKSELLKKRRYRNISGNHIDWAYGLKKAGYATDPDYAEKLINIVNTYGLEKYDNMTVAEAEELIKG